MIIKRDDRILEARYLSREGDTGTRWWSAMCGRNKLSVFNGSAVTSELSLGGRPGQIVFAFGVAPDVYVSQPNQNTIPPVPADTILWNSSGAAVSLDKTGAADVDYALLPFTGVIGPDTERYIEVDCTGSAPTSGKIPCIGIADTAVDTIPYPGQNRGEWGVQYDSNPYVISRNTASAQATLSGLASVSKRLGIAIRMDYAGAIESVQVCTTSGSFLEIYSLNGNTSSSDSPKRPRLHLGWGAAPSGASGSIRATIYQSPSEWTYAPPTGYTQFP